MLTTESSYSAHLPHQYLVHLLELNQQQHLSSHSRVSQVVEVGVIVVLLLAPAAERVTGTFEHCTSAQIRAHKEHAVNYAVREFSSKHASCVYANRELIIRLNQ